MQKILLYYKFFPVADPQAVVLWQKTLTNSLHLKGRILISHQGINGTVGGEIADLKAYAKATKEYVGFKDIVFKWSDGSRDDFPRMSVRARRELVGFKNSDNEFDVDEDGVVNGGNYLKPRQVHELVEKYGDDVIFFDGRNAHEAKIGKFKNAVIPNTNTSRDFIAELESDKYDAIKDKKIITYCTGGVRCEVISSMMKKRGFKEVYQIDGGIVKYGESYGDDGLWEGALRVFDKRMTINFSDHTKTIGECTHCGGKTSNFENCAYTECNDLVLICEDCKQDSALLFHSTECKENEDAKMVVVV
ncbi:rhodanese-related sulfurtransferase [Microbacteriaceae bacterium]|nr:rhodanese-related sulfurtransferase [Candidatus Saccharibacteria bacterium]